MARQNPLDTLVRKFTNDIEQLIADQVQSEVAARFREFRALVGGGAPTRSVSTKSKPGQRAGKQAHALSGRTIPQRACPVCRKRNKARRFSYLCDDHRTPENLLKFKGSKAKKAKKATPTYAKPAPAPVVTRVPAKNAPQRRAARSSAKAARAVAPVAPIVRKKDEKPVEVAPAAPAPKIVPFAQM